MDAVLIDEWLGGLEPTHMVDGASVALARQAVRTQAAALKLSDAVTGSLVNIVSELGHNQLAHARRGKIAVRAIERAGTPGLEIIAADEGRGISAPSEALNPHRRTPDPQNPVPRKSLGIGLSAVLELADETDFDVRIGEGTCVWARKFAGAVTRHRQVGIYGRPYPGEDVSGDHAGFVRDGQSLLVGLVDGLGHGPLARAAAELALATLRLHPHASVERIVEACHGELERTRGAVMAVARIDQAYHHVETACVGNVALRVYGPQVAHRFAGSSFVLGAKGHKFKPALATRVLAPRDVLIMFSDGLLSRFELENDQALLLEHPIVIAHQLVARFARDNDDVLVLVAH